MGDNVHRMRQVVWKLRSKYAVRESVMIDEVRGVMFSRMAAVVNRPTERARRRRRFIAIITWIYIYILRKGYEYGQFLARSAFVIILYPKALSIHYFYYVFFSFSASASKLFSIFCSNPYEFIFPSKIKDYCRISSRSASSYGFGNTGIW